MKALSKTTHLLVKMHPKRNFSWFDVQLSSPYVRQELVKRNRAKRAQALWDRIDDGMITGIGFALFEEEFHQFMQDKSIGKFKLRARCLTADGTGPETTRELQGCLEGVLMSGNAPPDIEDGKYYQPQSKNFAAFDSWTSNPYQTETAERQKRIWPCCHASCYVHPQSWTLASSSRPSPCHRH